MTVDDLAFALLFDLELPDELPAALQPDAIEAAIAETFGERRPPPTSGTYPRKPARRDEGR